MTRSLHHLSRVASLLALVALASCGEQADPLRPDLDPRVDLTVLSGADALILAPTVHNGATSREAQALTGLGYTFDVATTAEWATLTAADFSTYRVIVLGDPHCQVDTAPIAAAEANAGVWGPVVNGNVIVIGTDPDFHGHGDSGAWTLIQQGIAFAADAAGKTGAYITTSCYYHFAGLNTPVPLLSGLSTLGSFTARGVGGHNDAYITASHPALAGLTNADLSNWFNSIHNGFDSWPSDFEVLAMGRDIGAYYTAPDGTQGVPYILARGEGLVVISDIALEPLAATGTTGSTHTVTATVEVDGAPVEGTDVTFTVVDGPHAGVTGTTATDASGVATFSYLGTVPGTDGIRASFVDPVGVTQTSSRVTMEWTEPVNIDPVADASATAASAECTGDGCADVTLDGSASHDPDGTIVDWTWTDAGGAVLATGETAVVKLPLGSHDVTLTVTDDFGATASTTTTVVVEDTGAPTISFVLTETTLWSPNHQMVTVAAGISASDACGAVTLAIEVTSNEPIDATGDGNTDADWLVVDNGDGTFDLQLRAERQGNGSGRVYTITVTATDGSGNETVQTGEVTVPKSQGKNGG